MNVEIKCFFCSWKVPKLWHCARSKFDPGSWTSRHCLFFHPVTKLHKAGLAQKLKGCQKLSGSVTRLRVIWDHHNCQATTHPEALLCNTRKQRGAFKLKIHPWFGERFFIRGGFWLRLPRFVENSKYFNLRFNLLPEVRTDHHHQYAKLLSLWYI